MGRKEGSAVPLSGGAGSPYNTMWTGPSPTSVPSGILIHPAVWPQQTWAENGGCASLGRSWVPHLTQYGRVKAYLHVKFHLAPATIHRHYT